MHAQTHVCMRMYIPKNTENELQHKLRVLVLLIVIPDQH